MLTQTFWTATLLSLTNLFSPAHAEESSGSNVTPLGMSGEFEIVFFDEFEEPTLDLSKWTTCYWWDRNGCTNLGNNELQWYMPDNVRLENGYLVFTAIPEDVIGWEGKPFSYTSGMVTTGRYYLEDPMQTRFEAIGGVFEMRAKLPSGQGLWPAFWLLPSSLEPKPEIDVVEVLGRRPEFLEMNFHYRDDDGEPKNIGHSVETVDLTKGWHTYSVDWRSDKIVWYLDGVEMWRYSEAQRIPNEPMYLLLNLAVGGNWPGD
ncbi:MAG: glycoside hydrolase family 16 protein, partial [Roseibium sp.]